MAIYFTKEIFRLLKDLHNAGYVHRDIKPSNFVRETYNSHVFRMIDFGVTKQVDHITREMTLSLFLTAVTVQG